MLIRLQELPPQTLPPPSVRPESRRSSPENTPRAPAEGAEPRFFLLAAVRGTVQMSQRTVLCTTASVEFPRGRCRAAPWLVQQQLASAAACSPASVVSYTIARRSLLVYCSAQHDSYTSSPDGASCLAYSKLSDQYGAAESRRDAGPRLPPRRLASLGTLASTGGHGPRRPVPESRRGQPQKSSGHSTRRPLPRGSAGTAACPRRRLRGAAAHKHHGGHTPALAVSLDRRRRRFPARRR